MTNRMFCNLVVSEFDLPLKELYAFYNWLHNLQCISDYQ